MGRNEKIAEKDIYKLMEPATDIVFKEFADRFFLFDKIPESKNKIDVEYLKKLAEKYAK